MDITKPSLAIGAVFIDDELILKMGMTHLLQW